MWVDVVVIGVMVAVAYWVLIPLFRPRQSEDFSSGMKENRKKVLQQRKEAVYEAIKEMDFDYGMKKISEDDYNELKSQYKARALEILKELDTVDGKHDTDGASEKDVKRQRGKRGKGKGAVGQVNFCPKCGSKTSPDNIFCHACGVKLVRPGGRD